MKLLAEAEKFFRRRLYVSHNPDYSVLFVYFGVVTVTSILSRAEATSFGVFGSLIAANLGAIFLIAVALVLFLFLQRRKSAGDSYSIAAIVLTGLIVGFIKWALTAAFLVLAGLSDLILEAPFARAIFSSVAGMIFFPSLVLFSTIRGRYLKRQKFLVEAMAEINSQPRDYPGLLLDFLENFKDRLGSQKKVASGGVLANEIRGLVNSVLRPLSHELWNPQSQRLPSFQMSELLKSALRKHVYFWPLVVPISLITSLAPVLQFRGLILGSIFLAAKAGILLVVFFLASKVATRTFTQSLLLFTFSIALVGLLNFFLNRSTSSGAGDLEIQYWILTQVWIVIVSVTTGVARAMAQEGRYLDMAYSDWISAQVDQSSPQSAIALIEDRQLAKYLHGSVQTKLSNLATYLEQSSDQIVQESDLRRIDEAISEALSEFHSRKVKTVEEAMLRLEDDWGGLIQLAFFLEDVPMPAALVDLMLQVINEGVANAYRHGRATRVTVTLGSDFMLTLIDDGQGPADVKPGLGSALFNSISTEWSLTRISAGTSLQLKLNS